MSRRLLTFAALFSMVLPLSAADPKPPASVADLAWIAGQWQSQKGGDQLDEHWSTPASGTMMGMFRWIKDGKILVYELLVLEDGARGPVLVFRHFGAGLIGWEEKDKPLRCPLAGGGPGEAAFACEGTSTRLTFRRVGDNGLTVLLERQKDGQARTDEFVYTRTTPAK
jgi:hypothetical protein